MTPDDRSLRLTTDESLAAVLTELAGSTSPDYRDDIVRRVALTRQRRARTFIERWLPMSLLTARPATAPPLRSAWVLLLTGLLLAALVASLVIVGALVLRDQGPDGLNAGMLVPTVELDETWDTTTIPGLGCPSGMDLGPDGNVYLVNAAGNEIVVLDPDGEVVRRWGRQGDGPGELDFQTDPATPCHSIGGVAVASDGSVYVADSVNHRVQHFDAAGRFIREWGGFGPGDGEFLEPHDVDVDAEGKVYVIDHHRDDIQRFSPEGRHELTFGSRGSGNGQMNLTGTVLAGPDGVIYNADYGNHRVQAFDSDGAPLWSLGAGRGNITFRSPGDMSLDGDGFLYVSDLDGLRVFDRDLNQVGAWEPPESDLNDDWFPFVVSPDGWIHMGSQASGLVYRLRIVPTERTTSASSSTPAPTVVPVLSPVVPSSTPTTAGTGSELTIDEIFPIPFTIDLPPGWTRNDVRRGRVEVAKLGSPRNHGFVGVYLPIAVFSDPCRTEDGPIDPPIGLSVDDLTAALTNLVGFKAGPVTDITIDGYRGTTFVLEHKIDITGMECSDAPWLTQMTYDGATTGEVVETKIGVHGDLQQRIAILDVDGRRVLLQTWTYRDSSSRLDVEEAFQMLESIDFE